MSPTKRRSSPRSSGSTLAAFGQQAPDAIVDWAHRQGAKTVVLKLGAQGCLVSDGQRRALLAARRVPLLDATGAGDCFCGNFLARLATGTDAFGAACYANVALSLAVRASARWPSCRARLPSRRRLPPATRPPEPSFRSGLHPPQLAPGNDRGHDRRLHSDCRLNADPGVVAVRADAPCQSIDDLLAQARKEPGGPAHTYVVPKVTLTMKQFLQQIKAFALMGRA